MRQPLQNLHKLLSLIPVVAILLTASMDVAEGACSTVASTVTCTGGAASSVIINGGQGSPVAGSPFPSTLVVSGAPVGSTISSVKLRLNGYTAKGTTDGCASNSPNGGNCNNSADVGILLAGPSGANLEVMRGIGAGGTLSNGQTNIQVNLQDGATVMPDQNTGWTGLNVSQTWAPTANSGVNRSGSASLNFAGVGGPAIQGVPAPLGAATFASIFTGLAVNGTWNLYLADDAGVPAGGFRSANVTFSSWDLIITFSAASTPSTTTLTPSPSTAYTVAPNNSVTLTANVTAGATGSVTFKDGGVNLSCSGANPATIVANTATCVTTFSTEGIHALSANYGGDSSFVASSGSANVFIQKHATNVGTTYCNTGPITNNGQSNNFFTATSPYPSVIFVGDGVNTDILNSVNTVSLQLKGFSSTQNSTQVHMLLVAPDGTHAYDFWSNLGSTASLGDYTLVDGSPQLPLLTAISPGTYGPTAAGPTDLFTPGPPTPAPQVPGSFFYASPAGGANSKTFQQAFVGAPAHGAWRLFMYNGGGVNSNTSAATGWCLTISPATGAPTTVTLSSNPTPFAAQGASVTFTANVTSTSTVTAGTVTFTENGAPLVGAPNGGVANVVNGVATIATSGLPEGDHIITGTYHHPSGTFNDNFGTVSLRVDKSTSTPTLTGSTWSYCNTGAITIPAGTVTANDIGPAGPNPSNVFVTALPGTVASMTMTLKGFHVSSPVNLESLLVGPNGVSAPTTAQTLDFFSLTGGVNVFGPQDTTFTDVGSVVPSNSAPAASSAPTSRGATSYTASPFFTLPGTVQHATTAGAFTFNTGAAPNPAVYKNTIANGAWSMYFNQLIHDTGSGVNNGWCVNFIQNPVTVNVVKGMVGNVNGNFKQGQQGAQLTVNVHNNGDFAGNGSTGDPDGLHPLTIVDTLNANLTPGTLPTGTPWNCTAVAQVVTCKSSNTVAAGGNYPQLVIPVNGANNAPASVTNSVSASGGGITPSNSNNLTIGIDPAPVLSIAKSHTGNFTQGSTGQWSFVVTNSAATANGSTVGTTTITDTLPAGYTYVSDNGNGWSCSGTTTITCTSSQVVAGAGGVFNTLILTVNVPANSPVSVNNSAKVFGGGDLVHTNAGTAASSNTDTVTVLQVPASITLTAGNGQSATINTAFATILKATVLDAGSVAISGVTVAFTAPASGASGLFANSTITTSATSDVSGMASATTFTANSITGPYNVAVTAGSITNNFALTNTGGPATHFLVTAPLTATAGAAFSFTVTALDASNNTATGFLGTVHFTSGDGQAILPADYTFVAGDNGIHTFSATLKTVGLQTITGTSGAINGSASVTVTAGAATTMTANAGTTPQSTNISTAFSNALAVTVSDAFNNPVSGVNVTFTAPGAGASGIFSNSTATIVVATNASGVASASFTANATAGGPYNVTAAATGVTTVNFSLTNVNSTAVLTTVNPNSGQQGQINLSVALTGQFTHFVQGTSTAAFGTGITVNTVNVTDATHATANISIAGNATIGASNVTVITGGEVVTLTNGFTVTPAPTFPIWIITKSHTGNFSQGQNGATYTIKATNSGTAPTNGTTVTVTESVPAGLTLVSITGAGWTCGAPNPANVCTRTDVLGNGASYPALTVTVNVGAAAAASVTNSASVTGGGAGLQSVNDPTTINPITDVTPQVNMVTSGLGRNRATGLWSETLTVTNTSASPISGPVQVVLSSLSANATMVNNTGLRNGSPYITVSGGTIQPGASVAVTLTFQNPTNGFINFTPLAFSGTF